LVTSNDKPLEIIRSVALVAVEMKECDAQFFRANAELITTPQDKGGKN